MDLELQKGFQELQSQVIESRTKIAQIDTYQKLTMHEAKVNESILEDFAKASLNDKFIYEPVGRMLVKREGSEAKQFLENRDKSFKEKLKSFGEIKEICTKKVKDSEKSLRELVNKKLNRGEANAAGLTDDTSSSTSKKEEEKNKSTNSFEEKKEVSK